ncbi:hypothetical protein ACF0H5_003610 [Mactra antiquata]
MEEAFLQQHSLLFGDYPRGKQHEKQWAALGAWFLGPKAENIDVFNRLAIEAFNGHADFRRCYYPTDSAYVIADITATDAYKDERKQLEEQLAIMIKELKNSVPEFSVRFQGHMNWDSSMPGNLGYLAALLYNANNVANEASPVTTQYEIEVGEQLCEMLGFIETQPAPWGHITSCGSIANIEALWACRNIKYYPFCIKKALKEKKELAKARDFTVYVPRIQKEMKLVDLSNWDLLNLDIDEIVAIPDKVMKIAGISADTYSKIVDENNLASLGWYDFMKMYGLENTPVILAPKSMHYSWPKAAILLGIGQQNIIGIEFDKNARMDIKDLEIKLQKCLKNKTPVISLVAVIGTTEESAVDPLADIVELRKQYKKKGLDFAINADAAWGGYFMTMLPSPTARRDTSIIPRSSKFATKVQAEIPTFSLSDYTTRHLMSLGNADTITVDPHKSGFCPYPAGGLCYRNGNMRGFVKVEAAVVYHQGTSPSVGIWGVEGSKPGAAAAGVLLSHRTIGLDQLGYGRILGQCTLGAKLLYCVWLILAKDDDNFVCVPMKPLPDNMTMSQAAKFIEEQILYKESVDLQKDGNAMKFLKNVGPDTLINPFAVNLKGNRDLDLCNKITYEVFRRLSHTRTKEEEIYRIPLILTSSKLHPTKFGVAVEQFKERLGLPGKTEGDLTFLINTVMDPWVAQPNKIITIGSIVRQTVLNAIGMITDEPDLHGFVSPDMITDDGYLFGDHMPMFDMKPHQYHAIAKFNVSDRKAVLAIKAKYMEQSKVSSTRRKPIIFGNKEKSGLLTFLENAMNEAQEMDFYVGPPSSTNKPFLTTKVKVLDIPLRKHFDMTLTEYPAHLTYFMYGNKENAYLSHNLFKKPDVFQVVKLDNKPADVPDILLEHGIDITIDKLEGKPLKINGKIVDSLQFQEYSISYIGIGGIFAQSTISMTNDQAKVWFDVIDC